MKLQYEDLDLKILYFENVDVITSSQTGEDDELPTIPVKPN